MKKYILIILVTLAALAGCAKTEPAVPYGKAVSFQVGQYSQGTKAAVSLDSENITSFRSKGFLHGVGVDAVQDFFGTAGETISYDSTVPEWAPASHPYYWPKSSESYVDFVSWYDKNGEPDNVAGISETAISWTIDGSSRSLAADDNIMIADEAWRYVSDEVPTLFHHLLAQIRFVAKPKTLSKDGTTWTITVRNFRLSNIYTTGSISLSNADPLSGPSTVAWTGDWVTSGTTTTLAGSTLDTVLAADGSDLLAWHSVIPQNVGSAYISFDYTIRTVYDAQNYIEETASTGNLRISNFGAAASVWEKNKKLTYTITIDPEYAQILIDPVSEDWTYASTVISLE